MKNQAIYLSDSRMSFLGIQEVLKPLELQVEQCSFDNYKSQFSPSDQKLSILIVDLQKAGLSFEEVKKAIEYFGTASLMITANLSTDYLKSLFQIGFESCLTKDCSEEEMVEAVEALLNNKKFYCNNVLIVLYWRCPLVMMASGNWVWDFLFSSGKW